MSTSPAFMLAADFDPNPDRSVWIDGELNQALLDRLQPTLMALTSQAREPITVFINSPGGRRAVSQRILNLLSPCKTITVACYEAQSAAADLLSSGDWAIALPESTLLYHGTTITTPEAIGSEWATSLATSLKTANRKATASLVRQSTRRFAFIVSALRQSFGPHRINVGQPALTDIQCFQAILREKLSTAGVKMLNRAVTRWEECRELIIAFQEEIQKAPVVAREDFEKAMLNVCIGFEWLRNGFDQDTSLNKIREHFAYLDTCFQREDREQVGGFLERCFFVAICRALQERENILNPSDALWLGLIDTIREDIKPYQFRSA